MAHPALALQRKSALGALLQGQSAPAPRGRLDYLIRVWRARARRGTLPVCGSMAGPSPISRASSPRLRSSTPNPPLFARYTATRQRALALVDHLDDTLGPALRVLWCRLAVPASDPDIALRVLTTGMGQQGLSQAARRCSGFFHRSTHSAISIAKAIWRENIGLLSQLPSIESSTSGKAARSRRRGFHRRRPRRPPPRCWGRSAASVPLPMTCCCIWKDYRATLLQHPAAQWAAGIYRLRRG